ncbi:MAG: response regulator transcription factor [Ideonella sp.]|nr:response regulator transcription factor [Ideonella sp.]MCC7455680.1 response regulator transcription factor [Nitrospira sp.]
MNPPRALIAEDEPLLRDALAAELRSAWPELQLVAQVGDGERALGEALALRPEVCFLDIRMPGASGLEVAQALAEDWPADRAFPLLVFVTAYDQYALKAFEAQAVDYLVKPWSPPRLAACVQRLRARLAERKGAGERADRSANDAAALDERTLAQLRALLAAAADESGTSADRPPRLEVIQAGVGNMVHLVPVDEVVYFEAADKYVRVVTAEREHLIRTSLRELLPQLDPQRFWQVHRGTVVRARSIASAQRHESGKVTLTLRERAERLTASRLYAHLFKGQ